MIQQLFNELGQNYVVQYYGSQQFAWAGLYLSSKREIRFTLLKVTIYNFINNKIIIKTLYFILSKDF